MKILLLIDSLYSGGAQRQIVGLAELLKEKGYDIKLADYWEHDFYDDYLREKGIVFEHRVAKGKLNIFNSVRSLIRDFKPDAVVCYLEHSSMIACVVKMLHLTKPFRLIVSERNTTQHVTGEAKLRFGLFKLAADKVVCNSHSQTNFIAKNFPSLSEKTVTITNYLDTNKFVPGKNKASKENSPLRLIVVGRVVEQKNVIRFLEAISKVHKSHSETPFTVDWYGQPHPQEYFEECLSLRQELELDETVRFNPPKSNIVEEYQKSDVFILPSIYEGFPNVLCEAMSCGLPVVASNVCDNPDILERGKLGLLFDPLSVDDMAEKIREVLTFTNEERKMMGEKCRQYATERFSKDKFINSYISLLSE